jgi:hypothetical protein
LSSLQFQTLPTALACREDHALVDDLPIGKVQIASDYKQVINDIAEAAGGSYAPIIKEIGMHGRDFPIVNFLHEGRLLCYNT